MKLPVINDLGGVQEVSEVDTLLFKAFEKSKPANADSSVKIFIIPLHIVKITPPAVRSENEYISSSFTQVNGAYGGRSFFDDAD
jgi:hypothetical protein